MDNSKKNVHSSGPLGMLVKTGQIKKIDSNAESDKGNLQHVGLDRLKTSTSSYFRTQSGIEFKENELVLVDPNECESWEYANRSEDEMGNMDELIKSIQDNNQLQPALVRAHPNPHDGVKYQIIFGRRRHAACLRLGIPFLVIKKDSLTKQEAIACQDAENKFRKNVSNYSNAKLYKKLLEDKTFKTEKELAEKLGVSSSSLNDLMSFTKIPIDLVRKIPDVHALSVSMALKIVQLTNHNKNIYKIMEDIASEIGKSITSPAKLDRTVRALLKGEKRDQGSISTAAKVFTSDSGKKLFTFKDQKGSPCIVFHKDSLSSVDFDNLCEQLRSYLDKETGNTVSKSGHPDLIIN
jgi:ParB family chromosome partitioning protein